MNIHTKNAECFFMHSAKNKECRKKLVAFCGTNRLFCKSKKLCGKQTALIKTQYNNKIA